MAMQTVIANPGKKVDAWTAEDEAKFKELAAKRKTEKPAEPVVPLVPSTLERALELTRQAFEQDRASVIAFFPKMPVAGNRVVAMQTESDANFNMVTRKPHRFALFRVTPGVTDPATGKLKSNPYMIGGAFIIDENGNLDTKEFRKEVKAVPAAATK